MPIRILLIEDNQDHAEITKRILQKSDAGYQVDSAMDAQEGLKKIFENPYDAVLCDYRLPGLTALDILKEMNNKKKDTPFVVVTALGNEKVAVDIMKEGAYDYIVKDVLYNDTLDIVIKKVIDRYKAKKEKEGLEEEIRKAYVELRETQDQLIQSEKLSAIGQLASGVAHEVRNPLAIIMQGLNYLEDKIPATEREASEILIMLKDNIKRADKIINTLLDFSRAGSLNLQPEDINSILEISLNLVRARLKFENIDVILETKEDIPFVLGDKNKLEQVFINIFLNAVQAMPKGGRIIIRSFDKKLEEIKNGIGKRADDHFQVGEKTVIVEIEDTGIGITEKNLKRIFDPFFTTKTTMGGAGLGLSVGRNIIHMHKGLIFAESKPGEGTKITILLKVAKGDRVSKKKE
ncbi:MAG: response regulator [Candidatus Omnitrophica bacterium]|nr:response regulator [Candidatus Omnitrophota bacterium]